jgi:hypothetical protein
MLISEFSYQLESFTKQFASNGVMVLWAGTQPIVTLTTARTAEVRKNFTEFSKLKFFQPILTSNTLIEKSDEYDIFLPWLGTGLLTRLVKFNKKTLIFNFLKI